METLSVNANRRYFNAIKIYYFSMFSGEMEQFFYLTINI